MSSGICSAFSTTQGQTDNWEFAHGLSWELEVLRVSRSWSTQCCNMLPVLTENNGRDNAEEKAAGDMAHVAADEGKSHLFRGDPPEKPRSLSSHSSSETWSNSWLPPEMRSDGTAFLPFKGRGMLKGATSAGVKGTLLERNTFKMKCQTSRLQRRANRRRKPKKGSMLPLDDKKKGRATKAPAKSKATLSRVVSQNVPAFAAPGEGTTANPGDVLGLEASAAAVVLGSSLADRDREMQDKAMIPIGQCCIHPE
ncbi:hypothetical protein Acr_25g0001330 [Actinidia rufa]|uniref:Uncharacterized protein n=1 Tax=Actinidia rufa TaxID=165716 RepID=A0A7J0GYY6_9ERIC|nr:hypothetical protein Acr_25g0001330 [Actinidia rufa]